MESGLRRPSLSPGGVRRTELPAVQATDTPNRVVVLIEFDAEESARNWVEYITEKLEAMPEPDMSEVEMTSLDLVERADL